MYNIFYRRFDWVIIIYAEYIDSSSAGPDRLLNQVATSGKRLMAVQLRDEVRLIVKCNRKEFLENQLVYSKARHGLILIIYVF